MRTLLLALCCAACRTPKPEIPESVWQWARDHGHRTDARFHLLTLDDFKRGAQPSAQAIRDGGYWIKDGA